MVLPRYTTWHLPVTPSADSFSIVSLTRHPTSCDGLRLLPWKTTCVTSAANALREGVLFDVCLNQGQHLSHH
jgi:hypothetical protein